MSDTKKRGRPTKTEQELRNRIKELEAELERAQENAKNNLEYAKQAHKDVDRIQSESFAKGHQTKAVIDTVSDTLDAMDILSRQTRKALERDLTKDYTQDARQEAHQKYQEEKEGDE